jgi:hypothetical protein
MFLTRSYWQNRLAEFRKSPPGTEFSLTILAPDRLILGDPEICVREFHRWKDATGAASASPRAESRSSAPRGR